MRILSLRLIVALIVGVTLVSLASSWYEVQAEKDALRRDLERKAETFGESLAGNAESFLQGGDMPGLERMVQRFNNRDHVLGIGVYDLTLFPLVASHDLSAVLPGMPPALSTAMARNQPETSYARLHFKRLYIFAAPLHAVNKSVAGGMIIVYDTGYIRAEIFRVWSRVFIHIAGLVLVIVAITLLIVRWSLAGPIARAAQWMNALRTARHSVQVPAKDLDFFQPLAREMAPLAESMRQARAAAEIEARLRNTNESLWTAQRLADHVRTRLDGSNLFVVSNREPYVHNRQGNTITVTVPASGLVTALEPIFAPATGPGWPRAAALPTSRPSMSMTGCRFRRTILDIRFAGSGSLPEEEDGYYYGFANEGLWPLCHMAHTRPIFRASDWEHYNKVNARIRRRAGGRDGGRGASCGADSGLSFRAVAAHDERTDASCQDRDFLAYSLAQSGSLQHLPVAAGTAGWPAGCRPDRLSCAGALQQFPQHRRSRARSARRLGTLCGQAQGSLVLGVAVPHQRGVSRDRGNAAKSIAAEERSALIAGIGDRSDVSGRRRRSRGLYQRHPGTLSGGGVVSGESSAVSGEVHVYPDRRAHPQPHSSAMPTFRRKSRAEANRINERFQRASGGRSSF